MGKAFVELSWEGCQMKNLAFAPEGSSKGLGK